MEIVAKAEDISIGQPHHRVPAPTCYTPNIRQGHWVVVIEMNPLWLPLQFLDICTKPARNQMLQCILIKIYLNYSVYQLKQKCSIITSFN